MSERQYGRRISGSRFEGPCRVSDVCEPPALEENQSEQAKQQRIMPELRGKLDHKIWDSRDEPWDAQRWLN
jgi:hypothetical protein